MKTYTAMLRSQSEPVLVKEGFSWGALFLGPLWLAARGASIPAALSLAAYVLIASLAGQPTGLIVGTALAVILGLAGNDMRRWALEQRGYVLLHVLAARGRDEAWLRLLTSRPDLAESLRPQLH